MTARVQILGRQRAFATEVQKIPFGNGEIFHGEAIRAATKGLLAASINCLLRGAVTGIAA